MRSQPALDLAVRAARRALAGPGAAFRFDRPREVRVPRVDRTGLYVHVPFCRALCPYCPYTRVPYDPALVEPFVEGIAREAAHYAGALAGAEVTSVYVGGGTPTVLGSALERVLDAVRSAFRVTGPICVETHPADLTREKALALRRAGVEGVSLGVESFHPRLLALLGRRYDPEEARRALAWLGDAGFPTVNVDLMFALPTETDAELAEDVAAAAATCAGQITAYPLFTFPYTSVGRYRALRAVESPSFRTRRRMYYLLTDALVARGFRRASVWSFQRTPPEAPRFSSVTRERYVGLGPGAGSFYGGLFTLNTFSVPAWLEAVRARGEAVALEMPFSRRLSVLYDFYWRLYDTVVPARRSVGALSYATEEEPGLGALLASARALGLASRTPDGHVLTRRGALFIHFAQNLLSLRAIDRIWTQARKEAWPETVAF
jgi:oxygen-independent coproporphyrinogen-3 oxidase